MHQTILAPPAIAKPPRLRLSLRSVPACYLLAVLTVAPAWLATSLLQTLTPNRPLHLIFFFTAVAISSALGGLRAGIAATILSALICDFFFLAPVYSLTVSQSDAPLFILFVLVALLINGLSEKLHSQTRASELRLQALSRKLVQVQEAERREIARELHDEIGQSLTGLRYSLELLTREAPDSASEALRESLDVVCGLLDSVSEMSLDLRPAMLDDLGLMPALLWQFERYTSLTGVRVLFEHTGIDRRFAPELETTAYRIVQEALTNVARHAAVDEAIVRIWTTREILGIQVVDKGRGFDQAATQASCLSAGLTGMEERAALLEGWLSLESSPGNGTFLTVQLPLRSQDSR